MANTLTISMANYIRGLLEMKDLSGVGTHYRGLAIADITKRDDNGRAIYLDTRSPKALTFDGAKGLIEDLKALPYLHNSREEFLAAKAAKQNETPAPKAAPKAAPKSAPKQNKTARKVTAADGFVKGKATVGSRKGIAPVGSPVDGAVYSVYGASFKVVAKADKRGTVRLTVQK